MTGRSVLWLMSASQQKVSFCHVVMWQLILYHRSICDVARVGLAAKGLLVSCCHVTVDFMWQVDLCCGSCRPRSKRSPSVMSCDSWFYMTGRSVLRLVSASQQKVFCHVVMWRLILYDRSICAVARVGLAAKGLLLSCHVTVDFIWQVDLRCGSCRPRSIRSPSVMSCDSWFYMTGRSVLPLVSASQQKVFCHVVMWQLILYDRSICGVAHVGLAA